MENTYDKGMTKEDLRTALNLSPNTIAKMGKGENISMSVLHRICEYFNCQPGDLVVYIPDKVDTGGGNDGKR